MRWLGQSGWWRWRGLERAGRRGTRSSPWSTKSATLRTGCRPTLLMLSGNAGMPQADPVHWLHRLELVD
eukprot:1185379-Rhodomonas_salina.2